MTPERVEQREIVRLLRTINAAVYVLGVVRKRGDHPGTMQTPGLPDLLAFLPPRVDGLRLLMIEAKTARGRLSPAQRVFRDLCGRAGVAHVSGTLDAVIDWLTREGYLR